ncbi:MAG: protein kinase [Prevotella sp.]|nr:protein kinase [Prevotella sp.]
MDVTNRQSAPINTEATIRVGSPQAAQAGASDVTVRPGAKMQDTGDDDFQDGDFVLKGRLYRGIKCLSDNSGEAQVFLVEGDEGERVLKVYYPNFTIKKGLMRIIQNFNLEMIVKITDYGKTYVEGKNRDYELMEYLRGGTLADYDLNGDYNQFRRIALQAAAALAYCHNNNIIHKDIKPGNYFFRDAAHKEIVLGDFGISSIMEEEGRLHKTTQARTPVYAAPEMYNDVIDGEVEITPAVDFYSLGITLMTLWLGENPLSQNERVMMRKKNEGRLPRINELPDRVKMIVQGLTAVNPASRWGYDEVERWFLGEDVHVDISSPLLKYRSFIVDPERNLVADNVHELIPLLMDNERLATSYLYNGRIPGWLEQCGNVKLSSAVKDIIVNRYPADQRAGLMASVYVMEPTYPYIDLRGNKCDDIHSVAISILSYMEEYAIVLRNPNDNVFLYIESHTKADIARLRSYFAADSALTQRVAILRLVYEIDPDIPFLVKFPSGNIQDIVHSFGYEDCSEDEWVSLSDGRLLSWMYSHEDMMACEALRIMTEGQTPTRSLGYKVLYNLDRDAAYDLRDADNPYKVGVIMRDELKTWQDLTPEEFEEQVGEFADPNGRFYYFAQLHGWYEQLAQAKSCFELTSEENKERLGAYDLRTAAYRFCRFLGAIPVYVLEDGTELTDGTNFEKQTRRPILLGAMRRGALSQWMSVFYHEDPHQNFEEPYSYERRLEEWVMSLGEVDQNQMYYKRLVNAKEETTRKYKSVKKEYTSAKRKEHRWRTTFYGLCGLWLALLVIFGISNREDVMTHTALTIMLPVGGVSAIIVGLRAFFRGYGVVLSALWGLLGLLSAMIPIITMKYVYNSHPGMFVPTIILLTLIYMLICHLTDYHRDSKMENKFISEVMEDDVKTSLMEPLVYTFKQKSFKFKGSKFSMLDDVTNQVRSISGESVLHYRVWTMMIVLLLAEMILFNPKLMNYKIPDRDKITLSPNKVIEQLQKDVE